MFYFRILKAYLLDVPLAAAAYRAPAVCGGGTTNAEFPGLRFRFRRFLSRADSIVGSDSIGRLGGDGNVGVVERVEGGVSFVGGFSDGHTSIGEGSTMSGGLRRVVTFSVGSTFISAANSLSKSISSSTVSRNPRPSLDIASLRAFLTSWVLDRIPAGLTNSLPDDARRRLPRDTSSCTEKFGKSAARRGSGMDGGAYILPP